MNITLVKEDIILADGSGFKPLEVKNTSDVLRASLLMLFKHVADVHITVVDIIAEKYGLNKEDIYKDIQNDHRWKEMFVHPLLTDLTKTVEEQTIPKPEAKTKPKTKPKPKPKIILSDEEELIFE